MRRHVVSALDGPLAGVARDWLGVAVLSPLVLQVVFEPLVIPDRAPPCDQKSTQPSPWVNEDRPHPEPLGKNIAVGGKREGSDNQPRGASAEGSRAIVSGIWTVVRLGTRTRYMFPNWSSVWRSQNWEPSHSFAFHSSEITHGPAAHFSCRTPFLPHTFTCLNSIDLNLTRIGLFDRYFATFASQSTPAVSN